MYFKTKNCVCLSITKYKMATGVVLTLEAWELKIKNPLSRIWLIATSFPGSLLFTPQEAREGRPWLGLVTCLLKYGRLQISDWREGRLSVSLPILSVLGMGKHAPARINLQNRVRFKGNQRANLLMWAAVDFVNQLDILEILEKSLQQRRNRLLLVETEELLFGEAIPLCEFLPHLLCRPRERRPNNFRVVRSTISESQVSFELKVKR